MIQPGIYQHYAGKKYLVVGMATHSESNEELVLYIPLYEPLVVSGKHQLVVRPAKMWDETVNLCECEHSEDSHIGLYVDPGPCHKQIFTGHCGCKRYVFAKQAKRFTFVRAA